MPERDGGCRRVCLFIGAFGRVDYEVILRPRVPERYGGYQRGTEGAGKERREPERDGECRRDRKCRRGTYNAGESVHGRTEGA